MHAMGNFSFKFNIFCINDALLYHIIDVLSSVKQLCSALGPEMEILWSGTQGAAKKVSVRNVNFKGFVFCVVIYYRIRPYEANAERWVRVSCIWQSV